MWMRWGMPLSSRMKSTVQPPTSIGRNRRLVLDEFGVESDGGVPLWNSFTYFVGDSFELVTDRLGENAAGIPEKDFLAAKPG